MRTNLLSFSLYIFPFILASLIRHESPSEQIKKRYGDSGQLYCNLLLGTISSVCWPFTKAKKEAKVIQFKTFSIHSSQTPILLITTLEKDHSPRSYSFNMSSLKAQTPFFPFIWLLSLCIDSKPKIALSVIRRPGTNALWLDEMIVSSISLNQFAIILDMSL